MNAAWGKTLTITVLGLILPLIYGERLKKSINKYKKNKIFKILIVALNILVMVYDYIFIFN